MSPTWPLHLAILLTPSLVQDKALLELKRYLRNPWFSIEGRDLAKCLGIPATDLPKQVFNSPFFPENSISRNLFASLV